MKTYKVIGFGDSITLGAKARNHEYSWLGVLESQLSLFLDQPLEVINQGVGDNTISPRTTNYEESTKPSALERVVTDVIDLQPDMVLASWGLNDMRFGTPVSIFKEDLEKVIIQLQEHIQNAQLVLTTVYHMTGFDRYPPRDQGSVSLTKEYNEAINDLAQQYNIPLADVWKAMDTKDHLIHEDGVHGNELGHRIIGNTIFETIACQTTLLKTDVQR